MLLIKTKSKAILIFPENGSLIAYLFHILKKSVMPPGEKAGLFLLCTWYYQSSVKQRSHKNFSHAYSTHAPRLRKLRRLRVIDE